MLYIMLNLSQCMRVSLYDRVIITHKIYGLWTFVFHTWNILLLVNVNKKQKKKTINSSVFF